MYYSCILYAHCYILLFLNDKITSLEQCGAYKAFYKPTCHANPPNRSGNEVANHNGGGGVCSPSV